MEPSNKYQMTSNAFSHLEKMVKWVEDSGTSARQIQTFSEFFREREIPVDGRVSAKESILDYAWRSKCESLVLALLNEPALAPTPSSRGFIEKCLWSSRAMQKLIDQGYPARTELQTDQNMMPNILMNGDDKIISILAKNGMPLEQFNIVSELCRLPYSTLLYAADHSNSRNVLSLLKAGSPAEVCDGNGDTFLHKVLKNRSNKRAEWIDTNCIDDFRKVLKHCKAKKIPLDTANKEGQTALHVAAKRGYINSVLALLECGANAGIKDSNGRTPSDMAKLAGRDDIAQALHVHLVHHRVHDVLKANKLGSYVATPARAGK